LSIDFNFYWVISESDLEEYPSFNIINKVYGDTLKAVLLGRYYSDFACIEGIEWKNVFVFLEVITKHYRKMKDIIKKLESEVIHESLHGILKSDNEHIIHGLTMLLMNTTKYNYLYMKEHKPLGLKLFTQNIDNCIVLEG